MRKRKEAKKKRDDICDDIMTLANIRMRQRRNSNPEYTRAIQRIQRQLTEFTGIRKVNKHKPFS